MRLSLAWKATGTLIKSGLGGRISSLRHASEGLIATHCFRNAEWKVQFFPEAPEKLKV